MFACSIVIVTYQFLQQLQILNKLWPKLIAVSTRYINGEKNQLHEQLIPDHTELDLIPTQVNTTIISVPKT